MMLIILAIIAWIAILLFSIYVIILACPKAKEPDDKALICKYAHRGLHKDGVPENSLAAFSLACEKGFAMELDVHLSKDKEVMVFHDGSLKRMTGCDKGIHELTYAELSELRLAGTDEKIPTLREVLELVGGKVPLLIELKGESTDTSLCPEVAKLLREYPNLWCDISAGSGWNAPSAAPILHLSPAFTACCPMAPPSSRWRPAPVCRWQAIRKIPSVPLPTAWAN